MTGQGFKAVPYVLLLISVWMVTRKREENEKGLYALAYHDNDKYDEGSMFACVFTFVVVSRVTRRETKVVLEVPPLIQRPGWSVSYTDAVLVH